MLSWSHVIISAAGECSPASCPPTPEALPSPQARSLAPAPSDPLALVQDPDSSSSALMASYSVFVLEPGSGPVERALDCEAVCTWGPAPVWLPYLCITFGIPFVVMRKMRNKMRSDLLERIMMFRLGAQRPRT